jgi:hypothetical protein
MHVRAGAGILGLCSLSVLRAAPPPGDTGRQTLIPLLVPVGEPLRLYLTKHVPKRVNAPVEARLIDPVYAFDRQVIPTGTVVLGRVSRVGSVPKMQRLNAVMGGDFTPLHTAFVEFTTLVLPDGRKMLLHTAESPGLNTIMPSHPAKPRNPAASGNTGVLGTGKQKAQDAIRGQIQRAKSIPDLVRGPDKKERLEDYLVSRLPYHPQYVRKGTRFDAELLDPLSFGTEPVTAASAASLGTQPQPDAVAHARLITTLDSSSSKPGDPVHALLAEPVFSPDHKLILPAGTRMEGTVVASRKARWLHRSGQLRFTFREVDLPDEVEQLRQAAPVEAERRPKQDSLKFRTEANLQAAERGGKASLKVDSEGGVEAKESKTRFLAAAASVMVARAAGDNDPIRNQSRQVVGQSQNVGGRTLGGGFGFGLLGMAISQSSRYVGTAFGYYGMARSLYTTLLARGAEVQFRKNAVIDVRFNARPGPPATPAHPVAAAAAKRAK